MRNIRFYLIRHAQTDWNVEGRIQGIEDIPLNSTGLEQVARLATHVRAKKEELKIDSIYSSPLLRASDTAMAVGEAINVPVNIDSNLVEVDFGCISGIAWRDMPQDYRRILINKAMDPYGVRYPEGEDYEDTVLRAKRFLEDVIESGSMNIAVVSHTAILRVIAGILIKKNYRTMLKKSFGNCTINEVLVRYNERRYSVLGVKALYGRMVRRKEDM